MKKGPFKMKGPGLKNASPTKLLKPGRRPNKSTLHTGRSTDKISKRPASTASKAKRGFGNVAKQFKSEVSVSAKDLKRSTTSKIRKAVSKTNSNFSSGVKQFARAAKKSLPKLGKAVSGAARLGLRGSLVGGAIMAAGESMYKRGKKTGFKPPQFKKAKVNKKFNINKKK